MPRNLAPEHRLRSRLVWKVVAGIVTVISLLWVLLLLARVWPDLAAHGAEIRILPLLLGLGLGLVASYLTFEAFATLVSILNISYLPRRELAHLHFTAQLLKHLPGRVWGMGYQWAAGSAAGSLGDWLLANFGQMLFATFFALWSAWLVLGFSRGVEWGLLAVVGGVVIYIAGWMAVSSRRLSGWLHSLPRRFGKLSGVFDIFAKTPNSARVRVFFFFSTSWLLYYASWALNGMAYPPLGAGAGLQLCALYMLAWFVGYVSLLTPSGLGIRELVFAWLAKDFPGDGVALMAVIGRISLLSVDLAMGLVFAPFVPRKS